MAAVAITFDEIERSADRAFAYALLARLAKSYIVELYRTREVATSLEQLTAFLTQNIIDSLAVDASENGIKLRTRLQELHQVLAELCRSEEAAAVSRLPLFAGYVETIQEKTEDLGDIVDTLALFDSADFRNLVKCFGSSIGIQTPEEAVGRMQG